MWCKRSIAYTKKDKETCALDPLPSCVFTQCIDILTPMVTDIINASITQSHVPLSMKEAIVRPVSNKSSLDVDTLSSYRPVSNLTHVSKCLKKVIAQQLIEHTSDMTELYQSAYMSNHSTETALIAVCDDIKRGFDNRKGTALVMIDLSAAFDTINHSILLQRLRNRYGITHSALIWCQSHLAERCQRVSIADQYSQKLKLSTGVPQGSVLGPLLFSLYVQPIGDIIRKHGLSFHHYADDLQLYDYFNFSSPSFASTIYRLQNCVTDLQVWFNENQMIMNDDKTEFIPFVPKRYDKLIEHSSIIVGKNIITASSTVTNLGVVLDRNLTMAYQVSKIVRICTYKLRLVNIIRDKLSVHVAERVVNAMVTGNLDYCNSLLHGITAGQLGRIQKLQNTAARLILRRTRHSSATIMLHELHWLPIKTRAIYKLFLMVYKSQQDMMPDYITSHLTEYKPPRPLRSSEDKQLVVGKTHLHYGDILFHVAAAKLWNAAPLPLKTVKTIGSFKSQLKTYLFRLNL